MNVSFAYTFNMSY